MAGRRPAAARRPTILRTGAPPQRDVLRIEIQQLEREILAAQRRRGKAWQDPDMHRRQMEHAAEVQNFLRDKFTAPGLYLFL